MSFEVGAARLCFAASMRHLLRYTHTLSFKLQTTAVISMLTHKRTYRYVEISTEQQKTYSAYRLPP